MKCSCWSSWVCCWSHSLFLPDRSSLLLLPHSPSLCSSLSCMMFSTHWGLRLMTQSFISVGSESSVALFLLDHCGFLLTATIGQGEVRRWLSEFLGFTHIPPLCGSNPISSLSGSVILSSTEICFSDCWLSGMKNPKYSGDSLFPFYFT